MRKDARQTLFDFLDASVKMTCIVNVEPIVPEPLTLTSLAQCYITWGSLNSSLCDCFQLFWGWPSESLDSSVRLVLMAGPQCVEEISEVVPMSHRSLWCEMIRSSLWHSYNNAVDLHVHVWFHDLIRRSYPIQESSLQSMQAYLFCGTTHQSHTTHSRNVSDISATNLWLVDCCLKWYL